MGLDPETVQGYHHHRSKFRRYLAMEASERCQLDWTGSGLAGLDWVEAMLLSRPGGVAMPGSRISTTSLISVTPWQDIFIFNPSPVPDP